VIIDGHVHFWDVGRQEDIRIVGLHAELQRSHLPEDLWPLCAARGVERVILIQAAPQAKHTRWCLDLAKREERVAAVVGWVDLEAPDVVDVLSAYKAETKFVGIRAMVNRMPEPDWLMRPAVRAGFSALARLDLTADLLIRPAHLPACLDLCRALPALRVVIDHGGNPDIEAGDFQSWASWITEIGRTPRASSKVSGLLGPSRPARTLEQLKPFFGHLLKCFGPQRLIFGGDWPVVNLAGSYNMWWETFCQLLDAFGLATAERDALFGGTAIEVYRLPSG
jgi:L-fuconolactonase